MSGTAVSPFRQPKAVFAVAFACVVSFMGIGLVDPILPSISRQLHASPSEVTLLFTSYLVVTAVAMLITNWVSSRIGAKRTLIAGLIIIVVFSALAGASPSIGAIIGFRAGWGIGNALFIATSLAVIVASASGGFTGAIVLYETALGLGIAVGPLLGGVLGEISWRGPFFGVSALMAVALIATITLVKPMPLPAKKTSLSAPLRALRHRGLLTMSLTALCYNWGFFTVLGYAPFPMNLSPIKLGLVFTGWGVLVAIFAVFGAPRLQSQFGIARTMYANLAAFAVLILVIAIWTTDRAVLIPAVIASGIFIGVNNTITTQAVMTISPVERPVASAAYSFVRFIGGGLAPYAAGRLVIALNIHVPFFIAAGAVVAGIVILTTVHKTLADAERVQAEQVACADGADHPGARRRSRRRRGDRDRRGRGRRLADRRNGHRSSRQDGGRERPCSPCRACQGSSCRRRRRRRRRGPGRGQSPGLPASRAARRAPGTRRRTDPAARGRSRRGGPDGGRVRQRGRRGRDRHRRPGTRRAASAHRRQLQPRATAPRPEQRHDHQPGRAGPGSGGGRG